MRRTGTWFECSPSWARDGDCASNNSFKSGCWRTDVVEELAQRGVGDVPDVKPHLAWATAKQKRAQASVRRCEPDGIDLYGVISFLSSCLEG